MTSAAVLNFMKARNRPFSLNDILSNIKGSTKRVIEKALQDLIEKGEIYEKINEKNKAYCVVQSQSGDIQELLQKNKERESHAKEISSKLQEWECAVKSKREELSELKKSLTTEELAKQVKKLEKSVQSLENKLEKMLGSNPKEDLQKIKQETEKSLKNYRLEYGKRKRLCTDIMDNILEHYPGKKAKFYEELNIDFKVVS